MDQEKIDRINELYRRQKAGTLTAREKKEQAKLRAEYIDAIKKNLSSTLENTSVMEEDGTVHKLKKKKKRR